MWISTSYNMRMTLFFGEASMQNVNAIKVILRTFELVSGLKVNFAKSCFGTIGMSTSGSKRLQTT